MDSPTAADLERALALVHDAATAPTLAEFPLRVLPGLRALLGADVASFTDNDPDGRAAHWVFDPPGEPFPGAVASFEAYYLQHPLVGHFARTGDLRTRKLSDFVTQRALQRLELYQESLRPIDARFQLATALPTASRVPIGIGFMRTGPDFAERERKLLDLLRPHLLAAHENLRAQAAAQERVAVLERGLAEDGRGVVVLRGDGVEAASDGALRLLRTWFGSARPPLPPNGDALVVPGEGAELRIRLLPGEPRLLLLDERRTAPDPERARTLGLTPRETETLSLAARGLSDVEIAGELFVSPRTVHKHLEHAYRKLGVGGRREAIALLLPGSASPQA